MSSGAEPPSGPAARRGIVLPASVVGRSDAEPVRWPAGEVVKVGSVKAHDPELESIGTILFLGGAYLSFEASAPGRHREREMRPGSHPPFWLAITF